MFGLWTRHFLNFVDMSLGGRVRQLLYVSSKSPSHDIRLGDLLVTSRRRNGAAAVSGLLYTDGHRFLQVLEGDDADVGETFERIRADPRHRAIVVLSDRPIETREFGAWAMAHRLASDLPDAFDERLAGLLHGASPALLGTFMGLVSARTHRAPAQSSGSVTRHAAGDRARPPSSAHLDPY